MNPLTVNAPVLDAASGFCPPTVFFAVPDLQTGFDMVARWPLANPAQAQGDINAFLDSLEAIRLMAKLTSACSNTFACRSPLLSKSSPNVI